MLDRFESVWCQTFLFDKKQNILFSKSIKTILFEHPEQLKKTPRGVWKNLVFFLSILDTMVPHSWSFYFLTKRRYGFIKWGTDLKPYKMGGRFGADPSHFIGPVRRGISAATRKYRAWRASRASPCVFDSFLWRKWKTSSLLILCFFF